MAHIFEVMWTLEQKRLDNSFGNSPFFFLFSLLICLFMYNFLLILKFLSTIVFLSNKKKLILKKNSKKIQIKFGFKCVYNYIF